MKNPRIVKVHSESLIQVTFNDGLENPSFTINGLHFEADDEEYSIVACLRACAKLFNDKAESLESEFAENKQATIK